MNKVNKKEVKILTEAIQSVLDELEFDFMEMKEKMSVSYVAGDQAIHLGIMFHALEDPVDELEIPDEFAKRAQDFGFNNSHYKAQFIFKGNQYKLVGFKDGKCLVVNTSGKRFKLGITAVQKGIAETESGQQAKIPAKKANKKSSSIKPKKSAELNKELKGASLWQKGMQFLSAIEKQIILDTKGKGAEAKKVYVSLKEKLEKVYGDG